MSERDSSREAYGSAIKQLAAASNPDGADEMQAARAEAAAAVAERDVTLQALAAATKQLAEGARAPAANSDTVEELQAAVEAVADLMVERDSLARQLKTAADAAVGAGDAAETQQLREEVVDLRETVDALTEELDSKEGTSEKDAPAPTADTSELEAELAGALDAAAEIMTERDTLQIELEAARANNAVLAAATVPPPATTAAVVASPEIITADALAQLNEELADLRETVDALTEELDAKEEASTAASPAVASSPPVQPKRAPAPAPKPKPVASSPAPAKAESEYAAFHRKNSAKKTRAGSMRLDAQGNLIKEEKGSNVPDIVMGDAELAVTNAAQRANMWESKISATNSLPHNLSP